MPVVPCSISLWSFRVAGAETRGDVSPACRWIQGWRFAWQASGIVEYVRARRMVDVHLGVSPGVSWWFRVAGAGNGRFAWQAR